MENLWNQEEANRIGTNPLELRVYTSKLLGKNPSLVLHGGGNTSVKVHEENIFQDKEHILYVKGSGWDLATIKPQGFSPVRMETLLKLASLEKLSDSDMVKIQKSAMTDPQAPTPSVEAILHAIIPFKYVDHTHADAVVAITNTPDGDKTIREIYGNRILYIPYVMPGFILARKVFEMTQDVDWSQYEGMILMNHGIFSFADDAKTSYDRMIELVSRAENYLKEKKVFEIPVSTPTESAQNARQNNLFLAQLRKQVSKLMGAPIVTCVNGSAEAVSYSNLKNVNSLATRGPLTPDHVIHTKQVPLMISRTDEVSNQLTEFGTNYQKYFQGHVDELGKKNSTEAKSLRCLDQAPRWAVWPGQGVVTFGVSAKKAHVVNDIVRHTLRAQQWSEAIGGWKALPSQDIFEVEYWELEQAKLKKTDHTLSLQGKIALVTGAASGIGKACVESLRASGAAVVAVDINPQVTSLWSGSDIKAVVCDLTQSSAVEEAVQTCVRTFGGLDVVVANAGIFPASRSIESLDDEMWNQTLTVNLTSQMALFRSCVPYLTLGIDPTIIVMASKNVLAPGPGAAAYSVSKAGMTQLARVAALEFGAKGIRVNMLHPHAVMDTALWTPEILESRAKHYNMTVDEYKRNNLLKVEVTSKDVGDLVTAMASPLFYKITGAQLAVDGGSDRTI